MSAVAKQKLNPVLLAYIGALIPGIGCYSCLLYTYIFDFDRVRNFTTANCPELRSVFPPVSYSIGVWLPQKCVWLLVLIVHVPARLFFGLIYRSHWALGTAEFKKRNWFEPILKLHIVLIIVEMGGLVLVSVFDIMNYFYIHGAAYLLWLIPFDFNMLFNTMLHYYSGIRSVNKTFGAIFYIKCALFLVGYPLSVSTMINYLVFSLTCSSIAYTAFSIVEYMMVGINSAFYFLLAWESSGTRIEISVDSRALVKTEEELKDEQL